MKSVVIVLDNIRSALNVGAILRTCDGAGVERLYLCGITPTAEHDKVKKTALGAESYVDWVYTASTVQAIQTLQQNGYTVLAVEQTEGAKQYHDYEFTDKVALVFGHEITGVKLDALDTVDGSIELPMQGKKQSLNVATTVGILAYHLTFTAK